MCKLATTSTHSSILPRHVGQIWFQFGSAAPEARSAASETCNPFHHPDAATAQRCQPLVFSPCCRSSPASQERAEGGGEGWSRESRAERGGAPGGAGREEECTEGWRPRGEGIEKREKSQGKERGWERGCEVGFIVGVLNQNLGLAVIAHLSLSAGVTNWQ
jgi:hypothetical protein